MVPSTMDSEFAVIIPVTTAPWEFAWTFTSLPFLIDDESIACQELSPLKNTVLLAVPEPNLAVGTVPEAISPSATSPLKLYAVTIPLVLILPSL